jgi:hypothetical protein
MVVSDCYSLNGAGVLAKQIEVYWRKRGHYNVRAERFKIAGSSNLWGIRSNMVAGKPPKKPTQYGYR